MHSFMLSTFGVRDLMLEDASESPQREACRSSDSNDDVGAGASGMAHFRTSSRSDRRGHDHDVALSAHAEMPKSSRKELAEVFGLVARAVVEGEPRRSRRAVGVTPQMARRMARAGRAS
jgi:hypothetical protein